MLPFDVRSFRTTFATWCDRAGYDSAWTSVWLGHMPKTVTAKHYVKNVPGFEDVLLKSPLPGTVPPFPPLPEGLIEPVEGSGGVSAFLPKPASHSRSLQCEGGDLNPNLCG